MKSRSLQVMNSLRYYVNITLIQNTKLSHSRSLAIFIYFINYLFPCFLNNLFMQPSYRFIYLYKTVSLYIYIESMCITRYNDLAKTMLTLYYMEYKYQVDDDAEFRHRDVHVTQRRRRSRTKVLFCHTLPPRHLSYMG